MANLAEITATPEALNKAAQEFSDLFLEQEKKVAEPMNNGVTSDDDLTALFDACGNKDDSKRFLRCDKQWKPYGIGQL